MSSDVAPPAPAEHAPVPLDDQLWRETFDELKKVAHARLRAAGDPTGCNTTMLVNESWIKLSARASQQAGDGALSFPTRSHFFAYASRAMRSIVVDLLRERAAQRRGGGVDGDGVQWVTLDTTLGERVAAPEDEPLQVDAALRTLEAREPRLARVVELRYFAGMTETEVAEVLGVTDRTVRRDWDKARALLRTLLAC
ncbi:ECF-type sigma factor [Roseateles asaccharophilus]|uniref:RNA polymerase sigma factor (TIGR02999 family) n=1 Tax=Roseateles asaccharophilus TaxID=582607 RepID=A0ABU2ACK7_9BURK|nr:ECF-type sigma factor [Roseateles asaccharophilus]MDR7334941.1 RNA polymerase sigma factor (TIGR02999 family) [Roseateles asaccharophilus]